MFNPLLVRDYVGHQIGSLMYGISRKQCLLAKYREVLLQLSTLLTDVRAS